MSKCSGPGRAGTPACQKSFEFRQPRFLSRYLLVAVALAGGSIVAAAAPPNPIVILADDRSYVDLGVQGQARDVRTPHHDRFAAQGVRCTASRSERVRPCC